MISSKLSKDKKKISDKTSRLLNHLISLLRREIRLAFRTRVGRIGLLFVLLHVFIVLLGPLISPFTPTEFHLEHQLVPPSSDFLLGTDEYGRDILSRILWGARSIIFVSLAGTSLGLTMGTIVGMSVGYKSGKVDEIVMRTMDGLMSFPSLLLALLILTMLGSNQFNIIMTIGIVFMPRVARVMRSATLAIKGLEFVLSARLRGESSIYIIFREILPNTLTVLGVEASVRLSYAILIASSLGFLGLGVQPPSPDWGLMISESRKFLVSAPWVGLAPAGAVASLVVGLNLLSDGLKQARGLPREIESQ
jgi:peptide/nickel transport system permease protein